MPKIPEEIYSPEFLKYVEYYLKKFKSECGIWLHEYKDLEAKGLLAPTIIRNQYIKMLTGDFKLGYIRGTLFWYVGIYAADAAKIYLSRTKSSLFKIVVITGQTALDDDGDELTELSYTEASQICASMNEEMGEQLFIVKAM